VFFFYQFEVPEYTLNVEETLEVLADALAERRSMIVRVFFFRSKTNEN
jgi:hypothetical protein